MNRIEAFSYFVKVNLRQEREQHIEEKVKLDLS